MLKILRRIVLICIIGFFLINCDRILPDIEVKDTKPGIERSLAKGFNSFKGTVGRISEKAWKKAEPKLKKYGRKTLKNTEKVIKEEASDIKKKEKDKK